MKQVEVKKRQIKLFSYFLGLLSLWILGKSIGENGVAYLAAALESFYFVWIIIGNSIPDTLGKILRGKNAKGQYKNAHNMRRNIMMVQSVFGVIGSVGLFLGAEVIADRIFRMPHSYFILMLLAPAVFLRTVAAVLQGCFQGDGNELPTVVASVLRPIFLLGFGLLFGNILGKYGAKVSALLGQDAFTAMYGAMGIAIAYVLAEFLITLFLFLIYSGSRRTRRGKEEEGVKATDSILTHIGILYGNMGGNILLRLLESLPVWLGLIFYQKHMQEASASVNAYGIYFGKYLVLCGGAVALISIILVSLQARVSSAVRKDNSRHAKQICESGMKLGIVHSLFLAVLYAILAQQLSGVLGCVNDVILEKMLAYGSAIIVFAVLAYYFSGILILLDKGSLVLICAGVADVVLIIGMVVMFNVGQLGIMSIVYAGILGAAVYAIGLMVFTCRQLNMGIDWIHTFAIPGGSACAIGLLCLLFGKVFSPHLGNGVTLLVCTVLSTMLYWGTLLLLRCFREQETNYMPGGRMLRTIGQMFKVF